MFKTQYGGRAKELKAVVGEGACGCEPLEGKVPFQEVKLVIGFHLIDTKKFEVEIDSYRGGKLKNGTCNVTLVKLWRVEAVIFEFIVEISHVRIGAFENGFKETETCRLGCTRS